MIHVNANDKRKENEKSYCYYLSFVFLIAFAAYTDKDTNEETVQGLNAADEVIKTLIQAIDNKDWDTYINCYVNEAREDFRAFVSNQNNQEEHIGLFNIQTASLYEIKEMNLTDVEDFISVRKYQENYKDVKIYYCGIDYTVFEETKYFFNGVNYYLIAVVKEEDEYRIAEMSDAPIEVFRPKGIGFNSEAEGIALEKFYERYPKMRPE